MLTHSRFPRVTPYGIALLNNQMMLVVKPSGNQAINPGGKGQSHSELLYYSSGTVHPIFLAFI